MTATGLIRRIAAKQAASLIAVQRQTTAAGTSGYPTITYAAHLSSIPAMVHITSGAEAIRYGRENNRAFGTVQLQAGLDIVETDQLIYDGRTFDIQHVRPAGQRTSGDKLGRMILEIQETKP